MTTKISIRLGAEGGGDVKRTLDEIGRAGKSAFDETANAANRAGAAADRQAERNKRLAQAAREAEAQARAQARVNELLGVREPTTGGARTSASTFETELARREQIETARREQAARNAQDRINGLLGVRDPTAGSARTSAAAFEEAARREAERREATRTLIATREASAASGTARASSFQTGLNDRLGIGPTTGNRAADIEAYGRSLDNMRAKYSPLYAAQRTYLDQLKEIREAEKAGVFKTRAEAAEAITRTKEAFARQVGDLRAGSGPNRGLRSYEVQNLSFQVNDVFTSLASGGSLTQVFAQQAGQIVQPFIGPGSATVKGAFAQAGDAATAFAKRIGPVGFAFGGLATAVGVGTVALLSYRSAQREVEQSIAGVGRASGVTLGQINALADAQSGSLRLSTNATREIAATYVATGRVGAEMLPKAVGATRGFAGFLGVEDQEGATALAGILSDVSKGATDLSERYGLLSDAQAESVRRMAAQGDQLGAQKRLLDAVRDSTIDLAGHTSRWTRVTTLASDAWGGLGSLVDRALGGTGGGSDEQIRDILQGRLKSQQSSIVRAASSRGGDLEASNREIEETKRELDVVERRIARTKSIGEELQRNRRSAEVGSIIRSLVPEQVQLQQLQDKVEFVRKAISDPVKFGLDSRQMNDATLAFDRLARITKSMAEDMERFGSTSVAAANRAAEFGLRTATMNPVDRSAAELRQQFNEQARKEGLDPNGPNAAQITSEYSQRLGSTTDLFERQRIERERDKRLQGARMLEGLRTNLDLQLKGLDVRTEQDAVRSTRLPDGFIESLIGAESSGRDNIRNPVSSATGAGQFIDSTWLRLYKKTYGERARGMSDEAILSRRTNRGDSVAMIEAYAQENSRALEKANFPVTSTNLYMGHHFGEGGMLSMLRADPSRMARDVLGARAARDNPRTIGNLTVGQSIEAVRNSLARNEPGIRASREQAEIMRSQIGATDQSAMSAAKLERVQDLLNQARTKGTAVGRDFYLAQDLISASSTKLTAEQAAERKAMLETADAYARATAAAVEYRGKRELTFEREQLGRTDIEASAYARARGAGYGDLQSPDAQAFIAQAKLNTELRITKDLGRDALGGLLSDMRRGTDFGNALTNSISRIGDRLSDLALDQAFSALFAGEGKKDGGGWITAAITSAKSYFGAADGRVPRYADGRTPAVSAAGIISGPGGPRDDSILALVSNEEAIIRASSVKRYGADLIRSINEGTAPREISAFAREGGRRSGLPRFAGGTVPMPSALPGRDAFARSRASAGDGSTGGGAVPLKIEVINENGSSIRTREVPDGRGGRKQQMVVGDAWVTGIGTPQAQQAMASGYGLKPRLNERG